MKTSKKILGVVLALTMIFNVFAVSSFATFSDGDTGIKLTLEADAASYVAGDTITLTVSAQSLAEVGKLSSAGQFEIAYDSEYLAPISDSTDATNHITVADSQASGYDSSNSQVIFHDTLVDQAMSDVDANGAATYGWDKIVEYCILTDGCFVDTTAAAEKLFSFQFTLLKDAPAEGTVIGFNPFGWENYMSYIVDETYGGVYGLDASEMGYSFANNYEFGTCTITSGPSVVVSHVKQQSKWNGGNDKNTAENYLFGFVGQVSGLTLTTEKVGERDMVKEIQSITATATVGESAPVTADVVTVWAVDGGYQFRAQFSGFAPTNDATATVTFAITMNDGTTVYTSDAYGRAINDIYAGSLANNFPALAA